MTVSDDSEYLTVDRKADSVQKVASVALCVIAAGLSVYAAVNGVWAVAGLFLVGLGLAVQSYRAVETPRDPVVDGDY